jgi:hypothetical protein
MEIKGSSEFDSSHIQTDWKWEDRVVGVCFVLAVLVAYGSCWYFLQW